MLKREITFKTLSGKPITKEYYFNLSLDEIAELQFSRGEGFAEYLTKIVETKNAGALLRAFKEMVEKSVGVPDAEDISFEKTDERGRSYGRRFLESNAYTVLFMELLGPESTEDSFSKWMEAVIPAELFEQMPENITLPAEAGSPEKTLTKEDLLTMPQSEFDERFGTDPIKWEPAVLTAAFQRKGRTGSGG
jgi:hypothetical protein